MVRKLIAVLCLMLLTIAPLQAFAGAMVVDDANLFTTQEEAQLEKIITEIRKHQMDAVVVTSKDVPYEGTQNWADMYFENNGYGLGKDRAGILYAIDMYNRVPCISTTGVMIDYINDSRMEKLQDTGYEWLSKGEYGQAAIAVMEMTLSMIQKGREEGSFRYDAETGERLSGLYNALTPAELGVALIAGAIAAFGLYSGTTGKYQLKGKTYHYDTEQNVRSNVTRDDQIFLNEQVRRLSNTPPPSSGSSFGGGSSGGRGSSVHHSSSGMSHGGSVGRKF